jgi:uncharacterized protein YukE
VTGLVIGNPGGLLQFVAGMEKMSRLIESPAAKALKECNSALRNQLAHINRAQAFLIEQYRKSPLAKKRAAKINLTNAVNAALARARKTLHEVAESFETTEQAPQLFASSPPLISQHFASNAPNIRAMHRNNAGRTRALTLER